MNSGHYEKKINDLRKMLGETVKDRDDLKLILAGSEGRVTDLTNTVKLLAHGINCPALDCVKCDEAGKLARSVTVEPW